jgi:hypothetical protein
LLLRRYKSSGEWLTRTLTHYPRERSRDRATYFIWQADSALEMGDVEHACHLLGEAIPSISTAQSARNQKRVADIRVKLTKHHGLPAVKDVDERLRALVSVA